MPLGVVNEEDVAFNGDGIAICNTICTFNHFSVLNGFFGSSFGSNDMKVKTNVEWIKCLLTLGVKMYFICTMCVYACCPWCVCVRVGVYELST